MKKIFTITIFLVMTVFILKYFAYLYIPKHLGFNPNSIKQIDTNTDIIFVGPSTTHTALSPLNIWNKYGVTSYNLGSSGQFYEMSYYLLKKYVTNETKLVFFDISLLYENSFQSQNEIFVWYLNILDRINFYKDKQQYEIDKLFLYPYYDFHTRWKSLRNEDFLNSNFYGIRNLNQGPVNSNPQEPIDIKDNLPYNKLDKRRMEFITKLDDFAMENNIIIIYWIRPFTKNYINPYQFMLSFEYYAKEHKLYFINFSDSTLINKFDYKRDFIDRVHLNIYGGEKMSDYLIEYAIKNFNLPTHKNDPKYASWNEDYIKYARAINREEIRALKSFKEWQNFAYYDNYTMLISTNGDNVLNRLPQSMKDKFKTLGLNKFETDKKNQKYAAIIDNNQVFFEEVSDKKVEYKGRMKNLVNLLVSSEFNKATINVSGKPRAKNRYGINFVIYDKVNREIVDSIWVDPAKPDEIRR